MFKKFLIGLAILTTMSFTPIHAQNAADTQRIELIDAYWDASRGVKIVNPATGQQVYFKGLTITLGKLAVRECIHWGNAVTPWWIFFNRAEYSRNQAKLCAENVLAPIYAARKAAYEDARRNMIIASLPTGNMPNFFSLPSGFVPHSLKVAEYNNIAAIIDAEYATVSVYGGWGQLPVGGTPRSTDPSAAPVMD